jgi:hypothetical protein
MMPFSACESGFLSQHNVNRENFRASSTYQVINKLSREDISNNVFSKSLSKLNSNYLFNNLLLEQVYEKLKKIFES